jgi:hypothetical protein
MGNIINAILKFLAALCVLAFVLTAGVALLLFNAQRRLFDARLYLNALETQKVYERLPALASETIAAFANGNGTIAPPAYWKALPASDWEQIIRTVIPAAMTRSVTEQAITSVFDTLNGKSDTAVISLTEIKSYLGGPAGLEAVLKLLATRPKCTLDQLAEMTGPQGRFYLCNPPGQYVNESGGFVFKQLIESSLQSIAQNLPSEITLLSLGNKPQATLISRLQILRAVMRFSPLLPLALLLFIVLFAVRSLKDWLNWWGVSFLLGGLFSLGIAGAVNPLFNWALKTFAVTRLPSYVPASLAETIRELLSAVMTGVTAPIALQSVIILLAGIVMLIATRFLKPAPSRVQPKDKFGETPDDKPPESPAV